MRGIDGKDKEGMARAFDEAMAYLHDAPRDSLYVGGVDLGIILLPLMKSMYTAHGITDWRRVMEDFRDWCHGEGEEWANGNGGLEDYDYIRLYLAQYEPARG